MSDRILIVEDSQFFSKMVKERLENELGFEVVVAKTFAEAKKAADDSFFLNLLDLNLPDAPDGEVVDWFSRRGYPIIVFTGTYEQDLMDRLFTLGAIDYVLKDSPASFDYLIRVVQRIWKNRKLKVLAVDDSAVGLTILCNLLERYQLTTIRAGGGREALEILDANDDITLVITDYVMPEMDGNDLVKAIRKKWSKDELAVIGMSSAGDTNLSSRFIKMGANDFISKPFRAEELFCRINQNLDLMEHVKALNDAATKDFLTGLHNRRFFFDAAESIIAGAGRSGSPVAVALLDIDKFKAVNDTYGHDAGDAVLVGLAGVLAASVRKSDIVARFGGEKFCLLLSGHDPDYLEAHFKKLLREVWSNRVPHEGTELRVTASIGVVEATSNDIEALIGEADALLYQAKEAGRNRALIKLADDEKPLMVQGSAAAPTYD